MQLRALSLGRTALPFLPGKAADKAGQDSSQSSPPRDVFFGALRPLPEQDEGGDGVAPVKTVGKTGKTEAEIAAIEAEVLAMSDEALKEAFQKDVIEGLPGLFPPGGQLAVFRDPYTDAAVKRLDKGFTSSIYGLQYLHMAFKDQVFKVCKPAFERIREQERQVFMDRHRDLLPPDLTDDDSRIRFNAFDEAQYHGDPDPRKTAITITAKRSSPPVATYSFKTVMRAAEYGLYREIVQAALMTVHIHSNTIREVFERRGRPDRQY